MSPQRRTALVSVGAACLLVAIKLVAGLASSSLGLLSEAAHSGTDLVAALLTFFAVGVAVRPGRSRAPVRPRRRREHLAALAEAGFLVARQRRHRGRGDPAPRRRGRVRRRPDVVDVRRDRARARDRRVANDRLAARRAPLPRAPRSRSNALHFGSDFAGTLAVLVGLDRRARRLPGRRLDRGALRRRRSSSQRGVPADAPERRRAHGPRRPTTTRGSRARAIAALDPPVELRRLRMRQAGGEHFADVVIGVSPGAAVGQGHAAADRVEAGARTTRCPGIDVVVHVEPRGGDGGTPRARRSRPRSPSRACARSTT